MRFTVEFTENGKPLYFLGGIPIGEEEAQQARLQFGTPEHDEVDL